MQPIAPGADAPGHRTGDPHAVLFYKVTCPTCQIAAPAMERLHRTFPGRVEVVAQDPADRVRGFASEFGTTFDSRSDEEPFDESNAWGVRVVPTLFIVNEGAVEDVVESWDREGWNRAAARLGELTGVAAAPVSHEGDGLPPFRPG